MRGREKLVVALSLLIAASGIVLFVCNAVLVDEKRVITDEDVRSMPRVDAVFHSINNWETVEDTQFAGALLYEVLEEAGITSGSAQIKIIASDGYFWPAVGDVMTLNDLKRPNGEGLYPILAYEREGAALDPEPEGTGPLRLVMPQYAEDETNKPSWVSNVRLIEVGPRAEDGEAPDAAAVPYDEVWIYGDVAPTRPFPWLLPTILLVGGLALFVEACIFFAARKRRRNGAAKAPAAMLLVLLLCLSPACGALLASAPCRAAPAVRTFTMAELTAMPAVSAHYTFLKSQPPYTYYEADYRGVPLSYLIEEKMSLMPGASGVLVKSRDGYEAALSFGQVRKVYPGGLKTVIAYEKNGAPLSGDEGSLRLVVPQNTPGNKDQGGDANTPLCARMVYAVEVQPLPPGVTPPAASSVPEGCLAVYGSVEDAAAPPPAPPAPQPVPAPAPEPGGQEQQEEPDGNQPAEQPQPLVGMEVTIAMNDPYVFSVVVSSTALLSAFVDPLAVILPFMWLRQQVEGGAP